MSVPLLGRSSKKKRHSRLGFLLWSWSSLFLLGGVPVEVVFEGGDQGRNPGTDLFLLEGVLP